MKLSESANAQTQRGYSLHSNNSATSVIPPHLLTSGSARIVMGHTESIGGIMNTSEFFEQLDARVAKYDLLCHPFYKAWAAGELTLDDLRAYAQDYYHHVEAFPSYLAAFGLRLEDGDLRRAVLANMRDEKGIDDRTGNHAVPHSELWLDFAEG